MMKNINQKPFKSIFTKIFIIFLIIAVFGQIINLIIAFKRESQQLEKNLVEKHKLVASYVSHGITIGYLTNQWPLEYLAKLKKMPDIVYWRIIKPNGVVYQADDPAIWGKTLETKNLLSCMQENVSCDSIFYKTKEQIKMITHPIKISKPSWIFALGLSLKNIKLAQKQLLINYIYTTLLLIIITLLLAGFFTGFIVKPINKLTQAVQSITKSNDLSQKIKIKTKDEIGLLANSFNNMIVSLKTSYEKVNKSRQKEIDTRKRLEVVMKSMEDGIYVIDANKKIILFNKAAEKLSGWKSKEIENKLCAQIIKITNEQGEYNVCEKGGPVDQAIKTKNPVSLKTDVYLLKKDNTKIPISLNAAPFKDIKGVVQGVIVVFRDITQEKELEQMRIEKIRSEFVSIASHQLKTPLTNVKWLIEVLLSDKDRKLNKEQKHYLQRISKNNERMIMLINDLLIISRIEIKKKFEIKKQQTNIKNLVNQVIKNNSVLAKEKGITIIKPKMDKPIKILIDPVKITHVLNNLITNAIKFSNKGDNIEVRYKQTDKQIIFSVKDLGIGIPKNQQKRIFEKFFRADNAIKKETEGTGLGLYIAKAIIESHNSKIWFKSEENKGTTFYFSLPI